jgi:hypothetical protein
MELPLRLQSKLSLFNPVLRPGPATCELRDNFTCANWSKKMAACKAVCIFTLICCGTAFAFPTLPNQFCKSLSQSSIDRFRTSDIAALNRAIQPRRPQHGLSELVCMSKKDQRYRLAKRPDDEDKLLVAVSEQFRRREGQAQISWYPGTNASKAIQILLASHLSPPSLSLATIPPKISNRPL